MPARKHELETQFHIQVYTTKEKILTIQQHYGTFDSLRDAMQCEYFQRN